MSNNSFLFILLLKQHSSYSKVAGISIQDKNSLCRGKLGKSRTAALAAESLLPAFQYRQTADWLLSTSLEEHYSLLLTIIGPRDNSHNGRSLPLERGFLWIRVTRRRSHKILAHSREWSSVMQKVSTGCYSQRQTIPLHL